MGILRSKSVIKKMAAISWLLLLFGLNGLWAQAQPVKLPWDPRAITVDSRDNLYIEFERMLMKIGPDGNAVYVSENIAREFRGVVTPDAEIMITDKADNIYMTRAGMTSIWKMEPGGRFSIHAAPERYQNAWAAPAPKPVDLVDIEFLAMGKDNLIYISSRYQHSSTSVFYTLDADNHQQIILDNKGDTVKIRHVTAIAAGPDGALYVASVHERCIQKISREGSVTVVAGQCGKRDLCPVYKEGELSKAELVQPGSMVFNSKGDLFFADERMNRIIRLSGGRISTVAGSSLIQPCGSNMGGRSKEGYRDGKAMTALFNFPEKVRLAIDSKDNIYILDGGNNAIRKLTPGGIVSTVAINKN